ncbi:MAG: DUF1971 domain-containing protein [Acidimicrobiales bacterium]
MSAGRLDASAPPTSSTTTPVPAGLLRAHRVADGVWGRLVVHSGTVSFVFDDEPEHPITVSAGDAVLIRRRDNTTSELHDAASRGMQRERPQLGGVLPATPWDPELADAMEKHGLAVYEEELTEHLLTAMVDS